MRLPCPLRETWRSREGSAAVETAIVLPVFLALVLMIVQVGLMLFAQSAIDNAARNAARLIATGQVQMGGGEPMFSTQLCNDLGSFIACGDLQYTVASGSTFLAVAASSATIDDKGNITGTQFSPGDPGDAVLVQVVYKLAALPLLPLPSAGWLVASTVAVKNELYQ